MKAPLTTYANQLSGQYVLKHDYKIRKVKGQVFTPIEVAQYMASMFNYNQSIFKLLDPAAGTGILSAAVCETLLQKRGKEKLNVDITLYEYDKLLAKSLKNVLEQIKATYTLKGHILTYTIHQIDFVNANDTQKYDLIILNPPYFKINNSSKYGKIKIDTISKFTNIYEVFVLKAASLLIDNGEMVCITPRSLCSGSYFINSRKWLIENCSIEKIHVFLSRDKVFNLKEVLQESVIFHFTKGVANKKEKHISISVCEDREFTGVISLETNYSDIIHDKFNQHTIRIPISENQLKIIRNIDKFENGLINLNFKISTGQVVPFRTKSNLFKSQIKNTVPLLWMHNLNMFQIQWPLLKSIKRGQIKKNKETQQMLLPRQNLVLLKRVSSKEQKKRLTASVLLEKNWPNSHIGLENHINYIFKPNSSLNEIEAIGLAGVLNSEIYETYFRALNGSTQVNAHDIDNIPFPSLEVINRIGHDLQLMEGKIDSEKINSVIHKYVHPDM